MSNAIKYVNIWDYNKEPTKKWWVWCNYPIRRTKFPWMSSQYLLRYNFLFAVTFSHICDITSVEISLQLKKKRGSEKSVVLMHQILFGGPSRVEETFLRQIFTRARYIFRVALRNSKRARIKKNRTTNRSFSRNYPVCRIKMNLMRGSTLNYKKLHYTCGNFLQVLWRNVTDMLRFVIKPQKLATNRLF